jgi:biopolymer transport protein ExbD/biopolymer transport protein TolR
MGMSGGGGSGYQSEINVTPMVDIMLVLLIIFMVITPMLQAGVTVTLPKANSPEEDPNIVKDSAVVIAIPEAKMYYVKKDLMSNVGALTDRIKRDMGALKPSDPHVVYIKTSSHVPYGEVVQVVNAIRDAGFEQIGLVADKNKKPGGGS